MIQWYGGLHWAYAARAWLGLFAMQSDGRALLRHELTFFRQTPEVAAKVMTAFLKTHGIPRLVDTIAQPEIFPKNKQARGETVSETFRTHGIYLSPGDKDRVNGWARIRSWLDVREFRDDSGEVPKKYAAASLTIHASCTYFLDTFLTLVSDRKKPDDVEECTDEFPANGLRYFVMSRPLPPTQIVKRLPEGAIGHEIEELRRAARRR